MSKGLGKIERAIAAEIARAAKLDAFIGKPGSARGCWPVSMSLMAHHDWEPTNAQRKAVLHAMHTFTKKFPRYALMGGQGRKKLYRRPAQRHVGQDERRNDARIALQNHNDKRLA
jgi:hypothetical protein